MLSTSSEPNVSLQQYKLILAAEKWTPVFPTAMYSQPVM